MHNFRPLLLILLSFFPILSSAETISGRVGEDRALRADRSEWTGRPGVRVRLYLDNGDRTPNAADSQTVAVQTDSQGVFVATVPPGAYWVTADASTVTPSSGQKEGIRVIADQTFGPQGSLCGTRAGRSVTLAAAGPCFSGRRAAFADDASQLETSEHVALVSVASGSLANVDFGFSFDLVSTITDGPSPVQGSLRQFVLNANAVGGPNTMRFVPLDAVQEARAVGERPWWTLQLTAPLPPLEEETTIDGSLAALPLFIPGGPGTGKYVDVRPDLEVRFMAGDGLVFRKGGAVRRIAIHGATRAIVANEGLGIDGVVIGARADGSSTTGAADVGIDLTGGKLMLRRTLIRGHSSYGLRIGRGATADVEGIEVVDCGASQSGAAISVQGNDSVIRSSIMRGSRGPGIEIGSSNSAGPVARNVVENSLVSSNWIGVALLGGATETTITANEIVWNESGGVVASQLLSAGARNRVTRNHFNENGGFAIALGAESIDENLAPCSAVGGTVAPPRITSSRILEVNNQRTLVVEGLACPSAQVEIYFSYVTRDLRNQLARSRRDIVSVREALSRRSLMETRDQELSTLRRRVPSIGEFDYIVSVGVDPSGLFHAEIPVGIRRRGDSVLDDVLGEAEVAGLSIATLLVDAAGNGSELSRRTLVGRGTGAE